MNLVYVISAYKYPEQLERLVCRLNSEFSSFFIHVDRRTSDTVFSAMVTSLSHLSNVIFVERHECLWGGFGHVRATLKGIEAAIENTKELDYLILLTGQDYPIKSQHAIRNFLSDNGGAIFLDHFPLPYDGWEYGGMNRVESWHVHFLDRKLRFPPRFIPFKRKFPVGLKPFGGSSYWCLPGDAIEYLYQWTNANKDYVRFFKYVDVPDEIFFQTILLNSPFRNRIVNDNLRFIEWKDSEAASPSILRKDDFPALRATSSLFARKFDMTVDYEVLDMIDTELLGVQ